MARVANILTANGYNTGCGATVLRAQKLVDPDSLPLVAVWPQLEVATKQYGKQVCAMQIKIEGLIEFGDTNPSVMAEKMLGDIIENILGIEWTLPFTDGDIEIEVGDFVIGQTSEAIAYVSAVKVDTGTWGGSDAAGDLTLRRKTGTFQAENIEVGVTQVAATTGNITATSAVENTTNSLAQSIEYIEGGTEEYPDDMNISVGVAGKFNIIYELNIGDPYT